jgi:hypothetical protein
MNDDNTVTISSIYADPSTTVITANIPSNTITMSGNGSNGIHYGSIALDVLTEDLLEKWIMNRITVDHKVAEHELMKLKEHAPDYANEIKENLAKNATRDIMKKLTFTKKHDKDADVHHFIGRAWVFTEEELKTFIGEIKNA